jgi:hypothetical protein
LESGGWLPFPVQSYPAFDIVPYISIEEIQIADMVVLRLIECCSRELGPADPENVVMYLGVTG